MSKLRSINTALWSDTWVEGLTPEHKLLFIYLFTNEKTNMLGVYELSKRKISFETGLKIDVVDNGLKAFERIDKVKYIENYIILVNYMKHQKYNTNMKKSAIDIYNNLPKSLKDSKLVVSKDNPLKGFETLLNHYSMVRKVEVEVEVETEIEDEDEVEETNDNKILENDIIYPIEVLKENYLSNDKLLNAVIANKENKFKDLDYLKYRLDVFCGELIQNSDTSKTPKDFSSHFRNWNKKSKSIEATKSTNQRILL